MSPAEGALPDTRELDARWMPFTANRAFKAAPRLFASAQGVRATGDTIALSPPLVITPAELDELFAKPRRALAEPD